MSDQIDPGIWQMIAKWLWGILMTIAGSITVLLFKTVREHDKELSTLRTTVVTREELARMQQDHRNSMDELRASLTSTISHAVERVEHSNRETVRQIQQTQNMILEKLLK